MSDNISRQSAIAESLSFIVEYYGAAFDEEMQVKLKRRLESLPSTDRKGHWILTQDEHFEFCTCSECGYDNGENWMIGSEIPFCWHCGADMRGEQDE